ENVQDQDAGAYAVIVTNASGSVTSAVANLTIIDPWIEVQPSNQAGNPGDTITLSVSALGSPTLNYQWRKEGIAVAGATTSTLTFADLQLSTEGTYDVAVSNASGTATSAGAVVAVNHSFADSFNPGADSYVYSMVPQAESQVLVGGNFSTLAYVARSHL